MPPLPSRPGSGNGRRCRPRSGTCRETLLHNGAYDIAIVALAVEALRRAARRLLTAALGAQQDERWRALEAQIDRIYGQNEYALPRFGPARWLADGTAYTTVERTGQPAARDIVRYDAATGARSVLISTTQLMPAGASSRSASPTTSGRTMDRSC